MSDKKGLLKTCDRCGKTVFLKVLEDGVTDGGYTRWNRFEDPPEGWDYKRETGNLCPECKQEYDKLLLSFMNTVYDVTYTDYRRDAGGLY